MVSRPWFTESGGRFLRRHALQRWGVLLLRQVDVNLGLRQSLAQCFRDTREQVYVDHAGPPLLAQGLYGLALGYEDLNDHPRLRLDPFLAAACEKLDPLGQGRVSVRRVYVQLSSAYPLAGPLPVVPPTAHGAEARQRWTPPLPCRPSCHAGGVGQNRRKTDR